MEAQWQYVQNVALSVTIMCSMWNRGLTCTQAPVYTKMATRKSCHSSCAFSASQKLHSFNPKCLISISGFCFAVNAWYVPCVNHVFSHAWQRLCMFTAMWRRGADSYGSCRQTSAGGVRYEQVGHTDGLWKGYGRAIEGEWMQCAAVHACLFCYIQRGRCQYCPSFPLTAASVIPQLCLLTPTAPDTSIQTPCKIAGFSPSLHHINVRRAWILIVGSKTLTREYTQAKLSKLQGFC